VVVERTGSVIYHGNPGYNMGILEIAPLASRLARRGISATERESGRFCFISHSVWGWHGRCNTAGLAGRLFSQPMRLATRGIRFGEVRIVIQDGVVIQIDLTGRRA